MLVSARDFDQLLREHEVLLRAYRQAQDRCSAALRDQAREIARLRAEAMRLRAAVIRRDSALAWLSEDRDALERDAPGLARRAVLGRRVHALEQRIHELGRGDTQARRAPLRESVPAPVAAPIHEPMHEPTHEPIQEPIHEPVQAPVRAPFQSSPSAPAGEATVMADDGAALDASLAAADLVICQTGCLSHGAVWRLQDHCKRTGKTCVLVAHPDALRIVRIQPSGAAAGTA